MSDIALVFNGPIYAPATVKLRTSICGAANGGFPMQNGQKPQTIFLLLSSGGGNIDDGLSLYNLLRSLKIHIVTVNMSNIGSIANAIFLAGDHRIACPESTFHIHDFDWSFNAAHTMTPSNLTEISDQIKLSRLHNKSLFKSRTKLTDSDFKKFQLLEKPIVKDAAFAKEKGIVQEIGMPDLSTVTGIFNVEY
jgi:ATP-dependent protease ClpP protease subunit